MLVTNKSTSHVFLLIQISVCFCGKHPLQCREVPPPLVWNLQFKKQIQESPGHEVPPDSPYPQFSAKINKAFPKIASVFLVHGQLKGRASRLHNIHSRNHGSCLIFNSFRVRCFYIFTVTIGMTIFWRRVPSLVKHFQGVVLHFWDYYLFCNVNHDWSTNLPPNLPPQK